MHTCQLNVRLVSKVEQPGCIEFNGLWWKKENEEGYYTFNEAIEKFN